MISPAMGSMYVLLAVLFSVISGSAAQCSRQLQVRDTETSFQQCQSLTQGASVAWTFDPLNRRLEMGFSGVLESSSGWAGWGYNPTEAKMEGTSALLAFQNATGSHVFLYSVSDSNKGGAPLVPVQSTSDVTVVNRNVEIVYPSVKFTAVLTLTNNKTDIFHIWNRGNSVTGDRPGIHDTSSAGLTSAGQLNLATGETSQSTIQNLHLKNAHGILNAISWGILLPLGAIVARYMRPFQMADPAWFYIHVACQCIGYILGIVGGAIGFKLGKDSVGVTYKAHRNIAISLFVFSTLQVLAIFLRPNKDHKQRMFWNLYHWSLGYATIALGIWNIYKGFDILDPAKGWKNAYSGIIIAIGAVAVVLEVVTWIVSFHRRSQRKKQNVINKNVTNGV